MSEYNHAINWFEIPVDDFQRAITFYNAIMNYDMPTNEMNGNMMGFFINDPMGVGGAITECGERRPGLQGATVYLNGGDDLQQILDRVESAGGQVTMVKTQVSEDIGYIAFFIDSEGNKIGLHSRQ